MSRVRQAQGALLVATIAWGLSLTTADTALEHLGAFDLLVIEIATGTAAVVTACLLTGRRLGGAWRPAFVLGSLEPGLATVFANVGLLATSAAVGSMLFSLESVFVVLLVWLVARIRPKRVETVALGLGLAGTVLVASSEDGGSSSPLGIGLILLATVSAAGYTFAAQRLAAGHEPLALVARQGVASSVVTSPFVLGAWALDGSRILQAPASALLLAALTGILGFAVPFTLWTFAVPLVRPGFAAVALNLTPLVGVVGATVLGRGGLTTLQWAGGALILVGVAALARRELRTPAPAAELAPVPERVLLGSRG